MTTINIIQIVGIALISVGILYLLISDLKEKKQVVTITDLSKSSNQYLYMLLSRLQMDCEYYLKAGNRNNRHLWALDEKAHIDEMIGIYNHLKVKPNWLTKKQLKEYKKQILN